MIFNNPSYRLSIFDFQGSHNKEILNIMKHLKLTSSNNLRLLQLQFSVACFDQLAMVPWQLGLS